MNGYLIADTGPLIALSMVNHLHLLQHLFKRTLVPEMVHQEIVQGGQNAPGFQAYRKSSWIEVHALTMPLEPRLLNQLDNGEAAVIQLAQAHQADSVLIDERKARKIARKVYNLHVIGTMRVLLDAKKLGLIENVKTLVLQMRNGGYWIHDRIADLALKEAGEV